MKMHNWAQMKFSYWLETWVISLVVSSGSRRNSDTSGLTPAKMESRRNSDVPQRRSSQSPCKPLIINRRISDVDIQQLDKSPTQQCATVFIEKEIPERSESDSDHPDYSEKASLMTDKSCAKNDDPKGRKKSLTWKNDKIKDDDITTETSLLTDMTSVNNPVTVVSIINEICDFVCCFKFQNFKE